MFSRRLNGRDLNFRPVEDIPGLIARDDETGSLWDVTGRAREGGLQGAKLNPLPHFNKLFWFSWALFNPGTRVKVAA